MSPGEHGFSHIPARRQLLVAASALSLASPMARGASLVLVANTACGSVATLVGFVHVVGKGV